MSVLFVSGVPITLEMNSASYLALNLNVDPSVDGIANA